MKIAVRDYLLNFYEKYNYPEDAKKSLLELYDRVSRNAEFTRILEEYFCDGGINIDKPEGPLGEICEKESLPFYPLKLLCYTCLTRGLKNEYEKAGISGEIYSDTVKDLIYKMKECYEVHSQWGVFSPGWYNPVFHLKTFVLGRLAYNMGVYNDIDVQIDGRTITKGDKVINIHIPSSGEPFSREARLESYRRASEFFKDEFKEDMPVFKCDSWLLFEKNKEILGEGSNITSFINDFKMVVSSEDDDCSNFLWRIFGKSARLSTDELYEKTSMQRAFKKWLKEGKKLGGGMGVFIYNAEEGRIINK